MSDTSIESIREEISALEAQIKDKKAEIRALKPAGKSKVEPKLCADGCGQMTRGGLFLPGHDAKLRSRLLSAIDQGDESALHSLLTDYPTLLHGAAEADLRERLGSEQRKKDARVEHEAHRQAAKEQREAAVRAERKANARLKARSREEQFAAREQRLANKDRALAAAKSGVM